MKPSTGATPLFALEAAALDLETTGLDPGKALIVQIGLVHLSRNALVPATAWQRDVDPGIAIPAASTAIHGVTDAMARAARRLRDLWPQMLAGIGERVVIGHSIGFDLAVLAAEAKRNRLHFQQPRALDVRLLSQIVAPTLADHSLEALAAWLGLSIGDRHRALGDAQAAGLVFTALVPLLGDKGVATLAQAERACLRLRPDIERQQKAGWLVPEPPQAAGLHGPFAGVDTWPYAHTVGEVMSSPVAVVTPATTLKEAMDRMVADGISSVFVCASGEAGEAVSAYGILTERDVTRRISAGGAAALDEPCGDIATRPVSTVREAAFVYRAIGRMSRLKYRHLGVRSESDRLTGVVTTRDLLRLRSGPAIALDDAIEQAQTPVDLKIAWAALPAVVEALIAEELDAGIVCRIVSEEIRAMTRRAAVLAGQSMAAEGLGAPPCPFAVMVLGSGGRGESLLVPDQDNAIIFAQGDPDGPQDRWFAELGVRMTDILDRAGIPLCKGGVMARNGDWRGSAAHWRARIDGWVSRSRPDDLLNVDIFFDAMPVHGDHELAHALFVDAYERGHQSAAFAKLLGEKLATIPSPFSMFGTLTAPGDRLDLKLHALFPIAACARVLAIRHNIALRSTRERFEAIASRGIGPRGDIDNLLDAHRLCLGLLLEAQGRAMASGEAATNSVDLSTLDRARKANLKQALSDVRVIPDLIRGLMFA